MSKTYLLCASLLVAQVSPAAAQAPSTLAPETMQFVSVDAAIVALTNVQVIDGTGAPPAADQTVLLQDGRIAAVGPSADIEIPAAAEVMELSDHTIIPGLVGLHNHTFYTSPGAGYSHMVLTAPRLYLGSGVTTIRTTGTVLAYSDLNVKAQIDRGDIPGPKIHATGPYSTTAATHSTPSSPRQRLPRTLAGWSPTGPRRASNG